MKIKHCSGRGGFTLVELLAVMAIIVILAGIVVSSMGYVNAKQARSKAQAQIALLSKAIEDYKLDMGHYPATDNKAAATAPTGTATSSILFKALYWDSDEDSAVVPADTDQKIYLADLDPLTTKQGWTSGTPGAATTIVDPWGNEYCYRSALNAAGVANTSTVNPDFDLWSMGKDGETDPAGDSSDDKNKDDIRNF